MLLTWKLESGWQRQMAAAAEHSHSARLHSDSAPLKTLAVAVAASSRSQTGSPAWLGMLAWSGIPYPVTSPQAASWRGAG